MNDPVVGDVSILKTYFNTFKCFIGIGILATPAAIKSVGVVLGGTGILICALISFYTMKLQIRCKNKLGPHVTSYSEFGYAVYGSVGKAFVDFNITISQFGFCIGYLIFIGR